MQRLDQAPLGADRSGGASGRESDSESEAARQLQICNACRYCEGFCAVFPAMTRRLAFPPADIRYLANLCHHCGACLHACQYAPPHEFAVNLPRAMARVRAKSHARYAWPAALGRLYERNGLVLSLVLVLSLAFVLGVAIGLQGGVAALWSVPAAGSFYAIVPHRWMAGLFGAVFVFALMALAVGARRFWREAGPVPGPRLTTEQDRRGAAAEATRNVLALTYLGGGHGEGCNEADDAFSTARRTWHHFTFYGFALCFAATVVATVYHYALGRIAPYGFATLPKLLGLSGGVAMVIGTTGLAWLYQRRHPEHRAPELRGMDLGFIALLFGIAASGLALAVATALASATMPLLLCLHLGAVLAFFSTMPYSKFAHGVYRAAALLKWNLEKRRPTTLRLGLE